MNVASHALRVVDAAQTRATLPFPALIGALRDAFGAGGQVPPRHHHQVSRSDGTQGVLLLMPAWQGEGGYLGVKIVTIYPANGDKGLPGLYSTYFLSDADTGRPLALIDGDEITTRRTLAVSALGADFLARPDAETLFVVGAGRVARLAADAFQAIRPIRRTLIWSRDRGKAEGLARELTARGVAALAVESLEAGVRAADIVSCATLATTPLIRGEWLGPGVHLDLIGGFTPTMREADDACFAGARVFVDTRDAVVEAGNLIGPIAAGAVDPEAVVTLGQLCSGQAEGRRDPHEITVFKAVGTALSDIAAGSLVYRTLRDAAPV